MENKLERPDIHPKWVCSHRERLGVVEFVRAVRGRILQGCQLHHQDIHGWCRIKIDRSSSAWAFEISVCAQARRKAEEHRRREWALLSERMAVIGRMPPCSFCHMPGEAVFIIDFLWEKQRRPAPTPPPPPSNLHSSHSLITSGVAVAGCSSSLLSSPPPPPIPLPTCTLPA